MNDTPTPETDILYDRLLAENPGNLIYLEEMLRHARILELERDEAKEIAYDLAVIASHCIDSHSFALSETSERIAAALKRWKKMKEETQ